MDRSAWGLNIGDFDFMDVIDRRELGQKILPGCFPNSQCKDVTENRRLGQMRMLAQVSRNSSAHVSLEKVRAPEREEKPEWGFLRIALELRFIIYGHLLQGDSHSGLIFCPGRYKSDEFNPLGQRHVFSNYNNKKFRAQARIYPDFTLPVFMANHPFIFPIDAQIVSILSVCHQTRNEVADYIFKTRLAFSRVYDFNARIQAFLPRLPLFFRNQIKVVSIEIAMNSNMSNHFGNSIIPYLPLCENLERIELRFSMRFYRELALKRSPRENYHLFAKVVKLLISLLSLRIKGLKTISVGKAYRHGDEYSGLSRDRKAEADQQEAFNPVMSDDLGRPSCFNINVDVPEEIQPIKINFDCTIIRIFQEAFKRQNDLLSLPFAQKRLKNPKYQPSYQFYISSHQEKAFQLNAEVEPYLEFSYPNASYVEESDLEEEPKDGSFPKCAIVNLLLEEALDIYEVWLSKKYTVPRTMMEFLLAECESEYRQMGFEDRMKRLMLDVALITEKGKETEEEDEESREAEGEKEKGAGEGEKIEEV